jgi:hypothetical protein
MISDPERRDAAAATAVRTCCGTKLICFGNRPRIRSVCQAASTIVSMRLILMVLATCGALPAGPIPDSLRASLSFHASFDKALDADFARGDQKIYSAPDYKQQGSAKAGLGDVDAVIEKGIGVRGGAALRFRSKNVRALFFRGDRHAALASGTLSFWLRLDPQKDLAPGYTDPIQLTDKAYNDSAVWVDFTKAICCALDGPVMQTSTSGRVRTNR